MSIEIPREVALPIPTLMSAAGYRLVHDGIEDGITTPKGLGKVFVGRMLDLGDGFVARSLNVATRFGAVADAGFDKKATQEILDAVSEEGLIPEMVENAIRAQNLSNMALTVGAKVRHPSAELLPTRNGKRSMFGQGMTMGSYALAEMVRKEGYQIVSGAIRISGHAMAAAGLFYYGGRATGDYAARLR